MTDQPWTEKVETMVANTLAYPLSRQDRARMVLTALADAGLLVPNPDGGHRYRSTACLHATEPGRALLHRECAVDTTRYDGTHKTAATCKWCPARCVCDCHARQDGEEPTGWHGQPVRAAEAAQNDTAGAHGLHNAT